jgi:two-component sensor histidine kinase
MDEGGASGSMPLSEVRHRTANVFQLLSTLARLRAQRSQDAEARRQIEWLHDAIAALGVLQHRLLGPDGEDFAGFLTEMAPHWRRRIGGRPIDIDLDVQPVALPEQVAAAVAIIAQELVTNAVTHAFPDGRPGVVRVALRPLDADRALLSVADDGIGFDPAGVDAHRLGLWLIGGLADQVKGVLMTTHQPGVATRIEFPVR